jgi:GNAT superfamily N-acetyltransferase
MEIKIKVVETPKDLKKFIYLPANLYKDNENWIPPIYSEEWKFFKASKNKALTYSETIKILAYNDGKAVGRIMGIINNKFNAAKKDKQARFFMLECVNDNDVASKLINFIEDWAREKGMTNIVGPLGFSDKDPQGCLVEGFEHRAVITAPYSLSYMQKLINNSGYVKNLDLLSYKIPVPETMPALYSKIFERISRNQDFKILHFKSRKELKPHIVPVFRIVNETYKDIYAFDKLSEKEMYELADRYINFLDPRFVNLIYKGDEPIAFIVSIPDMGIGIQKAKGKLFPFGFIKILGSAKKSSKLVLLLGAVKEEYRGIGLDVLLAYSVMKASIDNGIKVIDSHLILEVNTKMRAEVERVNGEIYKRFRIFKKDL